MLAKRVSAEMRLGGLYSSLGNVHGFLALVHLDYGLEIRHDESQESRTHHPNEEHHEDRDGQRYPRLVSCEPLNHHSPRFLRPTSVVRIWVTGCS